MPEQTDETKIAVLETQFKNLNEKVDHLQDGVDMINAKLDNRYPTKEELKTLNDKVVSNNNDYVFWRNAFIFGIISLLVAIVFLYIKN